MPPAYGPGAGYAPGAPAPAPADPALPGAPQANPAAPLNPDVPDHPATVAAAPSAPYAVDPHTMHLGATPGPVAPVVPGAPPVPGADPAAERKRKVLIWTATLTAAFVIGGGATAGALLLKKNNDESDQAQNKPPAASQSPTPQQDQQDQQNQQPSATPSTSPSASPSPSASQGGATLPTGFVLKQDPAGFTVGVMDGWKRRQTGSQIYYEAPTGGAYLQIGIIKNTPTTSYENFLGLERKALETPERNYRRGQLIQNTYQGRPGALWEFTHVPEPDESSLRRHVIDQAFVAADGTEYAILAAWPCRSVGREQGRGLLDGDEHVHGELSSSRKQYPFCSDTGVVKVSASSIPSRRITAIERSLRAFTIATTRSTPAARTRSSVVRAAAVAYPLPHASRASRQPISISPTGPKVSCGHGCAPVKPMTLPSSSSMVQKQKPCSASCLRCRAVNSS